MPTAVSVANFIARYSDDMGAPLDKMALQKHLFYAQAFCLAAYGEELFPDDFEAWKLGPVVPVVWNKLGSRWSDIVRPDKSERDPQVTKEIEECILGVVRFFGRFTPLRLSDATHHEEPWLKARGSLPRSAPSSEKIPKDSIRKFYAGLISDGETALSRVEKLDKVPEPRICFYYRFGICARKMLDHPFYNMEWAELIALNENEEEHDLPDNFFAPAKGHEFIGADDF